jgi:serine protease Do
MRVGAFAAGVWFCLATCAMMAQQTGGPPVPALPTALRNVTSRSANRTARFSALDEFSDSVQRLLTDVNPAVVDIVSESLGEPEESTPGKANALSRQTREGTGVIVSADGDLITNAHVVMSAKRVQIRLRDPSIGTSRTRPEPRTMQAEIVGIDKETDLALLKIAGDNWKPLRLADSSSLHQGQVVFALGSPMGLENSVSMGIVSAVDRQLNTDADQAYVQTDAPINPGNSGGPLINTHGEIVGINTFIFSSSGGNQGLGFAIPSNLVKDVYAQLKRYGRVRRGELGVIVRTVTPTLAKALDLPGDRGVLIQDVLPGKPAEQAGLQVNDIVVRVEGRSVANLRQFSNYLFRSEIGGKLRLEVLRGGARAEVRVALKEREDDVEKFVERVKEIASPVAQLGVLVVPLNEKTSVLLTEPRSDSGCIVAAKLQTSSSFEEELEQGDLILGINGQPAKDLDALNGLLKRVPDGTPLVVRVERQGVLRYLVLTGE